MSTPSRQGAAPLEPLSLERAPLALIESSLSGCGLWFDIGSAVVRVRSDNPYLPAQLQAAYGRFPLVTDAPWADLHIDAVVPGNLRRWIAPQVVLQCDGQRPFDPFPADSALPMIEWGGNWLIGRRLNDLLLLHAGVVERDGLALVMPAMPGSGKSTLSAALSLRGWRLLSDEFGAYDPVQGAFRAMLKPVALKNQSIDVVRRFAPHARFGPDFPKTRKGTVAHLAAEPDAVARRHVGARPGAVVLPRWMEGSPTIWRPASTQTMFTSLAFNAFNYRTLGVTGFEAALHLARTSVGWEMVYSDLDDALRSLDERWPQVREHHADAAPPPVYA